MSTNIPIFKTPKGEAEYLAAYEATLKLWPMPYESFYVPTRFGDTHIIETGPKNAYPLLLLHGTGTSSTMWFDNIAQLSSKYRTYAIDIIGEVGKSKPTRLMLNKSECAEWLIEIFHQLGIEGANLLGFSRGAWLTLNFAISAPKYVHRLVLLSPIGAFVGLSVRTHLEVAKMLLNPGRNAMLSNLQKISVKGFHPTLVEQMYIGLKYLKAPKTIMPVIFTDKELRQLKPATLLLLGEKEFYFSPKSVLDRAQKLIPSIEAEIIPNAGHAVSVDQPALVNDYILNFIADTPNEEV